MSRSRATHPEKLFQSPRSNCFLQGTDGQRVNSQGLSPRAPSGEPEAEEPKSKRRLRESGGGRSLISNPRPWQNPVGAGIRAFHTIAVSTGLRTSSLNPRVTWKDGHLF